MVFSRFGMRKTCVLTVLCLVLASLLWLLAPMPVGAALEQRIAAVVNDRVVSLRDLNERLQLVLLTSGIPDSEQARARLAPQVLRSLIEEALQMQEADRLGIAVDDAEMQRALENIAQRNNMSTDDMRRFLESSGINFETLLRQVRAQIAWVKVVAREIRPRVNVTVDQLALAIQEARQSQGQPEYLLSEIVLPVDSPNQAERVAGDAQRLVQTLREGASFPSLARQVSVAASAEQGGDLGWVPASSIPPELLSALERLRPGEVSEPIGSPVGYHVFWLRDRRVADAPVDHTAAAVEVELTQILFPTDGAGPEMLAGLREQAAQLRAEMTDCAAMVAKAEELGAPASGALGWVKIGDMPPDLAQAVLALPVGEVSQPLESPAGIRLLMVCNRNEPRELAPQREDIAQRLEQEQIDRLARRYLRDLRKEAFVEVRL
jgi:peptidyl-prolyl cis-trans isomerase SurA